MARLPASPSDVRATCIGITAVLLWATLPLLTAMAGAVPPFQLVAMAFSLAFLLALGKWLSAGGALAARFRWPPAAWVVGVGGLFGYHFLYFMALRHAPPAEASLINHLWPLLIVLFSALLPGERLRWWHLAGAVAGLAGTALLVTDGGRLTFKGEFAFGYGLAVGCAFTWAAYSLLSRRLAHVPTDAVGAFCAVTAALALICHLAFETTSWPRGSQWLVVLALGLGPVGIAFFAWDVGVKHGNIRVLGAASYAAPLLATALLVAFGHATATWTLAAAAVLIVGGAALAASDMLRSKSPPA